MTPCIPIFLVSNVTGAGIKTLHTFLNAAHNVRTSTAEAFDNGLEDPCSIKDSQAQFVIEEAFIVDDINSDVEIQEDTRVEEFQNVKASKTVVLGSVTSGVMEIGREYLLGPTNDNTFVNVKVDTIERAHVKLHRAIKGQIAGLCIVLIGAHNKDHVSPDLDKDDEAYEDDEIVGKMEVCDRQNLINKRHKDDPDSNFQSKTLLSMIRKGSVLLDCTENPPQVSWEFTANMVIFGGGKWPELSR